MTGGAGFSTGPFLYLTNISPGKERGTLRTTEKGVFVVESPLLSIGMIVKDEIHCIEKCLTALQPLREAIPCELVIADTGSNDGTREVAERHADLLFDFPWVNDFSAARNAVLDRCTGKWCLIVDADEYLDPDFTQLTDFLTSAESERYLWGCVNIVNYPSVDMEGAGADFLACRLARLDHHPRYSGTIHESLSGVQLDKTKTLMDVRFHHSGYAQDAKNPMYYIQKKERNLTLLDQELEQYPGDLRRLLQCIESADPFPARRIAYARQAMKILQNDQKAQNLPISDIICCRSLETAVAQQMPELEEWRQWSMSNYPGSLFLQIDGNWALLCYFKQRKCYKNILHLAKEFLCAWERYQARDFHPLALMLSVLSRTSRGHEVYVRSIAVESLGHLGRFVEAATLLAGEPDWGGLKPAELHTLLVAGTWAAGEESLQEFVAEGAEIIRAMTGEDAAGMWDAFRTAANAVFQKRDPDEDAPERPWRLFTKVKGGLGQAVQIMEGKLPEIQVVLPQIQAQDWEDVPAPAVVQAVELGAELPEAFFTQSRERLTELATQISEALTPEALLNWAGRWDFTTSMTRFQFLFDLLSAALRVDKTWEEAADGREALLNRFLDVAADYLPNYYNQELLADKAEWTTLPGLHRFALHLLQGRADKVAGDELGCVRSLRAALKAAPTMKKAVSFLMDQLSKPVLVAEPSAELLALAEQVRTILSRYPADDSAVVALKQSDVYKKVAYLIEETGGGPAFGGLPQ